MRLNLDAVDLDQVPIHWPTTLAAAEIATDQYWPGDDVHARRPLGWDCEPFAVGGIEGAVYIGRIKQRPAVMIAFRGSDWSLSDWFRNFRAIPRQLSWRDGRGHAGYSRGADLVDGVINERLKGVELRGGWLWTMGHSLGGALARMTADRLLHTRGLRLQDVVVTTFGEPPSAGAGCALPLRSYRIIADDDLVPLARLPFIGARHADLKPTDEPPVSDWYRHIYGTYMIETETGRIMNVTSRTATARHVYGVGRSLLRLRVLRRIRDSGAAHRMGGYRDHIKVQREALAS